MTRGGHGASEKPRAPRKRGTRCGKEAQSMAAGREEAHKVRRALSIGRGAAFGHPMRPRQGKGLTCTKGPQAASTAQQSTSGRMPSPVILRRATFKSPISRHCSVVFFGSSADKRTERLGAACDSTRLAAVLLLAAWRRVSPRPSPRGGATTRAAPAQAPPAPRDPHHAYYSVE